MPSKDYLREGSLGIVGSVVPGGLPRELSASCTPSLTFPSSPFSHRHIFLVAESDAALILMTEVMEKAGKDEREGEGWAWEGKTVKK